VSELVGGRPLGAAAGPSPAGVFSCGLLVLFGLVAAAAGWVVWALLPTATHTYDDIGPGQLNSSYDSTAAAHDSSYDSIAAAHDSSYVWPSVWPRTCDNGRVVIAPEDLDCR